MRAGRMDQYVTIRRQVTPQAVDDSGAPVDAFEDWVSVWASVLDKSARLFRQGEGAMSEAEFALSVYDHYPVTSAMRVAWNGNEYQVVDYLTQGRGDYGRILIKSLTR